MRRDLDVELCNSTTCYGSNSSAPEPQRVIAPDPGGETWEVRVFASSAPVSSEPDYLYNQTARTVHVALMWEDRDRDDVEGPYCSDEIDMTCDECCAQAGASCAPDACTP